MADEFEPSTQPKRGASVWLARVFVFGAPILVIVGSVAAVVLMNVLKPKAEKEEPKPEALAVLIEPVKREPVRLTVSAQGEVTPRVSISLSAQVSGRIASVSDEFIDGGVFTRGDVLVRIDDSDYKLAVTQARSQVAQAQRALEREQAEADLAARDWADLGGEGDPSELTLRKPQLAEARAQLDSARAALRRASLDLERTRIVAPFTGRVGRKDADVGGFVSPGASLGEIFSTDVMEVRLPLTDRELGMLGVPVAFRESDEARGPTVTFSAVLAGMPRTWHGRVTRTDARIDATTRLVSAIAEVEDPFGAGSDGGAPMAPGLFVDAEIEGRMIEDGLIVARRALRGDDEVFVVTNEHTLSRRKVSVLASDRERVIIGAGVEPAENVVVSPLRGAFEGMALKPIGSDGQPLPRPEPDGDKTAARTGDQGTAQLN